MKICNTIEDMRAACREARRGGKRLGFVPTMGALHEGHLSLVRRARTECDVVVASIFVNPLQFGPEEDFAQYPRTFEADCGLLEAEGVEILFAPAAVRIEVSAGGLSVSDAALQVVREHPEGVAASDVLNTLSSQYGLKVRPNHLGIALQRHRRAGRLDQRDERWYPPHSNGQSGAAA